MNPEVRVSCAPKYGALVFRNDEARLELSPACGAVLSLCGADGAERVVPADEAFTLQLLDNAGIPTRIRSSKCAFEVRDGGTLVWHHPLGLEVTLTVRPEPGGGFAFTPEVRDLPGGMLLEWFDGPQIHIANDRLLYWPFYDGCEVSDLANREGSAWSDYRPLGWTPRRKAWGALYPGHAQMQFLAAYRDGAGLYFAADDRRHIPKAIEYDWMTPDATRLSLQTFCSDLAPDGSWRPALTYVVRPYRGGWMEACAMYRDWVRTLPGFDHPPARPAWMRDSPVVLIYPVQGEGLDHGSMKPNGYFPFINVLPHVARYAARLDSRILALLMHWEGTAPWAPPYLWPPLGGEEGLAALRDALHGDGHLLGLYGSGTAWTQRSMINGYSQEARCAAEELERHMMRGPRGEIDATICNDPEAQRLGYDLCLADTWSQETVADEIAKVARFGVDYCQFFDQNIGGGTLLCYARDHNHPPLPGAWLTDAMLALQRRLLDETARAGSSMLLGCEASAATPYARNLFFNDSREGSGAAFGRPVPGVPFVFHEWMCNFSGNQIGHTCDPFYRWTRAFHYGDMMALVLGRNGHLATAWGVPWDEAAVADEEALVRLVRDFCALRRRHPEFLLEGRMAFPFVECASSATRIKEAGRTHEAADILTSFWEVASGRRLGFATNWREEPVALELTWPDGRRETRLLAPRETIVLTPR